MKRSATQLFFKYLPNSIVDYNDGNIRCIMKVTSWDFEVITDLSDFAKQTIVETIAEELKPFVFKEDFPQMLNEVTRYVFLKISTHSKNPVYAEFFPITLECKNPECRAVIQVRERDYSAGKIKCPVCGNNKFLQIDIIGYHHCGNVSTLFRPKCHHHKHDKQHIILNRRGSSSPNDWYWRCKICNKDIVKVRNYQKCEYCENKQCEICKAEGNNFQMKLGPFRKRDIFYPLRATVVAVPSSFLKLNSIDASETLINYLLEEEMEDSDAEIEKIASELRKRLKDLGISENQITQIAFRNFREQKLSDIKEANIEQLKEKKFLIRTIETLQLLSKKAEGNKLPMDKNIQLLGVDATRSFVTESLPVFHFTYGYIRDAFRENKQKECYVKAFPAPRQYKDKTPIIIHQINTEGVVLFYNRKKILRWIFENKWIEKNKFESIINSTKKIKAFFLSECSKEKPVFYAPLKNNDENLVQRMVYQLIHTINHALIKSAGKFSGFDQNGLSELIFPEIPASIIYHNQATNYNLGGLTSLFNDYAEKWFQDAVSELETCKYDPTCYHWKKEGGYGDVAACHGCVIISETSCNHLNYDLDRRLLFGGYNDIIGFVQVRE